VRHCEYQKKDMGGKRQRDDKTCVWGTRTAFFMRKTADPPSS
jgi:hypothetical protein